MIHPLRQGCWNSQKGYANLDIFFTLFFAHKIFRDHSLTLWAIGDRIFFNSMNGIENKSPVDFINLT